MKYIRKIIEYFLFSEYKGILDIKNYQTEGSNFLNFIWCNEDLFNKRDKLLIFTNEKIPTYLLYFFGGKIKRIDRSYNYQSYTNKEIFKDTPFLFHPTERHEVIYEGFEFKLICWFLKLQKRKFKNIKTINTFQDSSVHRKDKIIIEVNPLTHISELKIID